MRIFLLFVLAALIPVSGCSSYRTQRLEERVDQLDDRVSKMEAREEFVQTTVETEEVILDADSEAEILARIAAMGKKDIQRALRSAGYYDGAIDGKIGPRSRKAIREFQRDHNLKVDGIVGENTKRALLRYVSE
jgi:peptidoglycan hydrolase-like protein with peptidoglycan-binding domain